jgi:L-ribulose-5-phosphate 3-epimerase
MTRSGGGSTVEGMNRRRFLQSTALATLAVSSGRVFAAEPSAKIGKAIMYATIGVKGSVLEKLRAVKTAGYEGVELMGGMDRNECVAALKETGLGAASVCCHTHWAKPLSSANPEDRKVGIEGLKSSLVDAKTYGAGSVLFVPGVARDGVSYEQCWDRSIAGIKEAIPTAEETGVTIAIENVWNDFITDEKEAVRYLDAIHHPLVKWHFDVGNIIRYGDPIDWIRALGPRIARIHIKEYSRDLALRNGDVWKGFNAKLLEGANNWPGIMKALRETGFSSWAITEQGGGGTPDGLKDLADRLGKILAS